MKYVFAMVLSLCFFVVGSVSSMANVDQAGFVKSVSGEVFITTSEMTVKAYPNMKIAQGDSISTGENSNIGLIFNDDTVVSVGPKSEIIIEKFLFNPVDRELSFVARMVRGTFSFITGQIAKLAPKKVKLETPDATLGVRGTKLLVKID